MYEVAFATGEIEYLTVSPALGFWTPEIETGTEGLGLTITSIWTLSLVKPFKVWET